MQTDRWAATSLDGEAQSAGDTAVAVARTALPIVGGLLGSVVGMPGVGTGLGQLAASQLPAPTDPRRPPTRPASLAQQQGAARALQGLRIIFDSPAFRLARSADEVIVVAPNGARVPVAAILSALASLASTAAAMRGATAAGSLDYLKDDEGRFVYDPANPDLRAWRIVELLHEDRRGRQRSAVRQRSDPVERWLVESGLVDSVGGR